MKSWENTLYREKHIYGGIVVGVEGGRGSGCDCSFAFSFTVSALQLAEMENQFWTKTKKCSMKSKFFARSINVWVKWVCVWVCEKGKQACCFFFFFLEDATTNCGELKQNSWIREIRCGIRAQSKRGKKCIDIKMNCRLIEILLIQG